MVWLSGGSDGSVWRPFLREFWSQMPSGLWIFDIHEIILWWGCPTIPSTGVIVPLYTSVVLSLGTLHGVVRNPVGPQTLDGVTDCTGNGGAANNLGEDRRRRERREKIYQWSWLILENSFACMCFQNSETYPAIAAHFVARFEALPLSDGQRVPWLNEVTQCHVHFAVWLQFTYKETSGWDES